MITIVDYGVGNLFSLKSSFAVIGETVNVTSDVNEIENAEKIILPGVGAFADAIKKLKSCGLDKIVVRQSERGTPVLGICLGMQLLFDKSLEYGKHYGLGILSGDIVPIESGTNNKLKIPHMGWNSLLIKKNNPLLKYINSGDFVYFVHSFYAANCENSIIATTEYGKELTAAVNIGNVFGCQFHPEKSGEVGLKILKAFCEI